MSELVGSVERDMKEVIRQFEEKNRFSPEYLPEMTDIIARVVRELIAAAISSQACYTTYVQALLYIQLSCTSSLK